MPDPGTRDRLLAATEDLIREGGVATLTLAKVAERAAVTRQAVYLHFGNRATLLTEMAVRLDTVSGFIDGLRESRRLGAVPGFRRMLELWLEYLPTLLPIARALEAATVTGDEGAVAYRHRMSEWREAIRAAIVRLAEAGELAPGWKPDAAADWVWSQVLPSVYDHLVGMRGWSHQEVVATTMRGLEVALLRRGVSRRRPSTRASSGR